MTEHIAIVGAGMGGLAAAIRLAASGQRVTVIERQPLPGGKLNRWQAEGFSFDTGPSLLTLPRVLDDLFAAAGRDRAAHLPLVALDPAHRYYWPDGSSLDISPRLDRLVAEVERLSPADVPALFRFLAHAASLYTSAAAPFLRASPDDPSALLAAARHAPGFRWRDAVALASPRTMHQRVAGFFRDPRLVQLFDRYATYNGSSPFRAPAAFCLIPHAEFAHGAWYPPGGMYRIAEALTALAAEVGVTVRAGLAVTRVLVGNGRALGLMLADGTTLVADRVVLNVDIHAARRQLLPPELTPRSDDHLDRSTSAVLLLLGLRRQYPLLAHHTIFFSTDYRAEFDDLFVRRQPPRDPTIYVCATTRTDASQAPPGGENLFVMVNVPALEANHDWAALGPPYRDQILATLERRGLTDLRRQIVVERLVTPPDLAAASGADRGALYGLASHGPLTAFRRPPNRDRRIGRLYHAGGTTHPGGGIPLALASGHIVADLIAADQRRAR